MLLQPVLQPLARPLPHYFRKAISFRRKSSRSETGRSSREVWGCECLVVFVCVHGLLCACKDRRRNARPVMKETTKIPGPNGVCRGTVKDRASNQPCIIRSHIYPVRDRFHEYAQTSYPDIPARKCPFQPCSAGLWSRGLSHCAPRCRPSWSAFTCSCTDCARRSRAGPS